MEADVACSTSFKRGRSESTPLLAKSGVTGDKILRSFDEALEGAGVGLYHVILLLVAGWALASDSVEVQCISFVTPQLDKPDSQLHPSKVTSQAKRGGKESSGMHCMLNLNIPSMHSIVC